MDVEEGQSKHGEKGGGKHGTGVRENMRVTPVLRLDYRSTCCFPYKADLFFRSGSLTRNRWIAIISRLQYYAWYVYYCT